MRAACAKPTAWTAWRLPEASRTRGAAAEPRCSRREEGRKTAGYGGIYVAPRDTATAVVEGGYADGIRRDYRGAEVVAAGGERMEIAAVCMDAFIAANAPVSLKPGDKVEVFGEDTLDSFLDVSDANVYEIYTSFKGRTERKYITDGKIRDTESDTFPPRTLF